MKLALNRLVAPVLAILLVAACATTASPTTTSTATAGAGQPSHAAAPSASDKLSESPRPSAEVAARCDKAPKPFDPKKVDSPRSRSLICHRNKPEDRWSSSIRCR